jgi:hypothetical protein
MGKTYDEITPELSDWIAEQKLFFIATAPLAQSGLVNCSPKGMDTFRLLGPRQVAYLDFTGSGIETIAHIRENGRIVVMFCALAGPPKIVRLHGTGDTVTPEHPDWAELRPLFPTDAPGERAIVRVTLTRISDSCGFSVPRFDYVEERDVLTRWAQSKTDAELADYRAQKNAESLDGLPGL